MITDVTQLIDISYIWRHWIKCLGLFLRWVLRRVPIYCRRIGRRLLGWWFRRLGTRLNVRLFRWNLRTIPYFTKHLHFTKHLTSHIWTPSMQPDQHVYKITYKYNQLILAKGWGLRVKGKYTTMTFNSFCFFLNRSISRFRIMHNVSRGWILLLKSSASDFWSKLYPPIFDKIIQIKTELFFSYFFYFELIFFGLNFVLICPIPYLFKSFPIFVTYPPPL